MPLLHHELYLLNLDHLLYFSLPVLLGWLARFLRLFSANRGSADSADDR